MEIKIPIEIVELEDNSFHIIVSLQIGSIEAIPTRCFPSHLVLDRNIQQPFRPLSCPSDLRDFRIAIHSQFDHRSLQYQAPNCQYGFTGNYIRVIFLSNNYLHVQLFIYIMLKTAYTRINGL